MHFGCQASPAHCLTRVDAPCAMAHVNQGRHRVDAQQIQIAQNLPHWIRRWLKRRQGVAGRPGFTTRPGSRRSEWFVRQGPDTRPLRLIGCPHLPPFPGGRQVVIAGFSSWLQKLILDAEQFAAATRWKLILRRIFQEFAGFPLSRPGSAAPLAGPNCRI